MRKVKVDSSALAQKRKLEPTCCSRYWRNSQQVKHHAQLYNLAHRKLWLPQALGSMCQRRLINLKSPVIGCHIALAHLKYESNPCWLRTHSWWCLLNSNVHNWFVRFALIRVWRHTKRFSHTYNSKMEFVLLRSPLELKFHSTLSVTAMPAWCWFRLWKRYIVGSTQDSAQVKYSSYVSVTHTSMYIQMLQLRFFFGIFSIVYAVCFPSFSSCRLFQALMTDSTL